MVMCFPFLCDMAGKRCRPRNHPPKYQPNPRAHKPTPTDHPPPPRRIHGPNPTPPPDTTTDHPPPYAPPIQFNPNQPICLHDNAAAVADAAAGLGRAEYHQGARRRYYLMKIELVLGEREGQGDDRKEKGSIVRRGPFIVARGILLLVLPPPLLPQVLAVQSFAGKFGIEEL